MIYENWEELDGIEKIVREDPVTFIHGDCMDFLRKCKEEMMFKHFHVGIVDVPYGINVGNMNLGSDKSSKPKNFEMGEWDAEVPTKEYWDLLEYCCRNIVAWGGNYITKEINWSGRCFVYWSKKQGYAVMAHGELALTTFDMNAVEFEHSRGHLQNQDEERRHPTQKPVRLYDFLHLKFCEKGQRILDTHGGSHSQAIAAARNNMKLTIIEKNKSYHDSGLESYKKSLVKKTLF